MPSKKSAKGQAKGAAAATPEPSFDMKVIDRVVHYTYNSFAADVPVDFVTICDAYEGPLPGRIGFNFPLSFVKKQFPRHPLCKAEADYVIGYSKKDILAKRHELQHAKYYMDPTFKTEVAKLWESLSQRSKEKINETLLRMKYANEPGLLLDEFQAYHFTEKVNFFGVPELK